MAQKTNLNISPYFDDFDPEKNFYKVLFKPGYPVQSRELTTLQSILQKQIESFGSSIFKDGSVVIPGSITCDDRYSSVRINSEYLGIPVSLYIDKLLNKKVTGSISGVTGTIINYSVPPNDNVEDITLYVKYSTPGKDFSKSSFTDNEDLIINETIVYGNTFINQNNAVATSINLNSCSTGYSVGIDNGIYFIRGNFITVNKSQIVLDAYSNKPSYRVGFNIIEEIVTSNDDSSLNDNAAGFSNFSAPGADRLKISVELSKKSLSDFDDKNFIELVKIVNGEIKKIQDKSIYSTIEDFFANRTYEESGNYSLSDFKLKIQNCLNDGISNNGIYNYTQKTEQGNTPSDDLVCIKVSSPKSYVYGVSVNPISTVLDVEKPRDTTKVLNSFSPFEMGNVLKVNNIQGTPIIGITTNNTVDFYNQRRGSSLTSGTGTKIGEARTYSYSLSDSPYEDQTSEWNLYLFDIQFYTKLTLNESLNSSQCPKSSYIFGSSSGASGFTSSDASSPTITLTQVNGSFINGEQILINGSDLYSRNIKSISKYNNKDVKSVYQDTTSISGNAITKDFIADTVLYKSNLSNFNLSDQLSITLLGNGTGIATCSGKSFIGIRSDAIIKYQRSDKTVPSYNRVLSVSSDELTLTLGTGTTVSKISDGAIPSSILTSFDIVDPILVGQEKSSLFYPLGNDNISFVDLGRSNLVITKQVTGKTTSSTGSLTINTSDININDINFTSFDTKRYSIFYDTLGTIEPLTTDQVDVNNIGTQITFYGLQPLQNVTVNVSLNKSSVKNKTKNFIRSKKLIVNKSVSAGSTDINGLSYNKYYGLRVEDNEISLNVPDVINIVAVYESLDKSIPSLDSLTFVSGLNLNTQSFVGEKIIGRDSGAIAQVVTRFSNSVEFVYLNSNKFISGEMVDFKESNISSAIQEISLGNYLNITNRYTLDNGQKNEYYDYSKIVRKSQSSSPTNQLLIIFNYYDIPTSDYGDIYTVNSYPSERYNSDIPSVSGISNKLIRCADIIDFRPRVSEFTSSSSSPFYFESKNFGLVPSLTPNYVVKPEESLLSSYDYYLPRTDKIVLNKFGDCYIIKGISSLNPKEPTNIEDVMDIATIKFPPYLYDSQIDNVPISFVDNKRYTMRDIKKIDDRVTRLEEITSLTLLELDTKSLQVQDSDGLSRFKSGFFVDDFKNNSLLDRSNPDTQCSIDTKNQELLPMNHFWSIKPILSLDSSLNPDTSDYFDDLLLFDKNVKKTGDLITLNFEETTWIEQPFASRAENINPFNVISYSSVIKLNPSKDEWVRNIYINRYRTVVSGHSGITIDEYGNKFSAENQSSIQYDYVGSLQTTTQRELYARERNVLFEINAIRPLTQHYLFINNSSSVLFVPKLIEIEMTSGIFEIGESVKTDTFRSRCAAPNHKTGPYNSPKTIYNLNPYNTSQVLTNSYSATSTILNIDTVALAEESLGQYGGYISVGQILVGETSGATATVKNVRLISDTSGSLLGSIYVPNTSLSSYLIPIGKNLIKLNSRSDNSSSLTGSTDLDSDAIGYYIAEGTATVQDQSIVQIRPNPPECLSTSFKGPLAQTFTVDETGAFLTSVDLFFASKDQNENVYVEIRAVELGLPTNQVIQDYASVLVESKDIQVSDDASLATNVKFPSPIYLQPNTEYALAVLSPTTSNNQVWIARMGDTTINTQDFPDVESVSVTRQYIGGSLFKPQNGTILTANQYEDLKFKLYKANFTSQSGNVVYYNPNLTNNDYNLPKLVENSIKTFPRKLKVGIVTTTSLSNILTSGTKVGAGGSATYGYVTGVGGTVTALTVSMPGIGYSNGSYTNVPLYTITGNGSGLTGNVTISGGVVSGVTVNYPGNGYVIGDVVGITTSSVTKGSGAQISVNNVNGIDTLYLTDVQGETFYPTTTTALNYYNGSSWVAIANTYTTSSSVIEDLYNGNVIEVTQFNHGMHSNSNKVKITGIMPDSAPSKLSSTLNIDANSLTVENGSIFSTFEGQSVTTGYILVNDEIIEYSGVSGNILTLSDRGIDNTQIVQHSSGSLVYKYELNNVSLRRLNTDYNMSSNNTLKNLRDCDVYYLEFDRTGRTNGSSQLSFKTESVLGGDDISATQNIQFDSIIPQFSVITPGNTTNINAEIRTVTATSAGGSEESFIDTEYESVELNKINNLSSTRMICSRVNEENNLSFLPNKKSFTLKIGFSSDDKNLSPVLDTQNGMLVLKRNRINNPISNYALDSRVNLVTGDPHGSIYISQKINLKQPATSLKVFLTAFRPKECDFRVLYQIFRSGVGENEPTFELFPGYDNLSDTNGDGFGDVILDPALNSGNPDAFVAPNKEGEVSEYQYSIDNLDPFTTYAIKIVMSSTDESKVPKIKDIRTIALS